MIVMLNLEWVLIVKLSQFCLVSHLNKSWEQEIIKKQISYKTLTFRGNLASSWRREGGTHNCNCKKYLNYSNFLLVSGNNCEEHWARNWAITSFMTTIKHLCPLDLLRQSKSSSRNIYLFNKLSNCNIFLLLGSIGRHWNPVALFQKHPFLFLQLTHLPLW